MQAQVVEPERVDAHHHHASGASIGAGLRQNGGLCKGDHMSWMDWVGRRRFKGERDGLAGPGAQVDGVFGPRLVGLGRAVPDHRFAHADLAVWTGQV